MAQENLPGTLYKHRRRWRWKVKLPGDERRRDIALCPPGSRQATTDRAVAVEIAWRIWEQACRSAGSPALPSRTVASLVAEYLRYLEQEFGAVRSPRYFTTVAASLRPLVACCGNMLAADLRPQNLRNMQDYLIKRGRARQTINGYTQAVKRLYKWAAEQELVPLQTYQRIALVGGLRKGQRGVREGREVTPVAPEHVLAVAPYAAPPVAAMLQLQLYTGMRSGEVTAITGTIWWYTPETHKTAHLGYTRQIPLGPRAQQVLHPFLARPVDAYCFSPREADEWYRQRRHAARKTPLSCGNRPGTNRKADPQRKPGDRYDAHSYYKAVRWAIRAARAAGVEVPDFHPHQIRHTAATLARRELGLDAARALLGHRQMAITDEYAEIDRRLAAEVVQRIG